jgi:uncharacterized protein (DUF1330 family)
MPQYFVAQLEVHDPATYALYLEGAGALLAEYEGRVLAVDEHVTVLEGAWPYRRTVLIEFPSADHLDRWYRSPGYQEIAVHRLAAAHGNAVSLTGRD